MEAATEGALSSLEVGLIGASVGIALIMIFLLTYVIYVAVRATRRINKRIKAQVGLPRDRYFVKLWVRQNRNNRSEEVQSLGQFGQPDNMEALRHVQVGTFGIMIGLDKI